MGREGQLDKIINASTSDQAISLLVVYHIEIIAQVPKDKSTKRLTATLKEKSKYSLNTQQ